MVEEGCVTVPVPVESYDNIPDSVPVATVTKAAAASSDVGFITPVFRQIKSIPL